MNYSEADQFLLLSVAGPKVSCMTYSDADQFVLSSVPGP